MIILNIIGESGYMKKILVIGCGNMGTALVKGWLEDSTQNSEPIDITIIDPNPLKYDFKAHQSNHITIKYYQNIDEIATDKIFEILIIAIKPQYADEILPHYQRFIPKSSSARLVVISVVAGKNCRYYENIFGENAAIIRVMPNTPALINCGMMGVYGNKYGQELYGLIRELFANLGKIIFLDCEAKIDAITALSGSGPAYIFALCEAMISAGVEIGLTPQESLIATEQTILGAAKLLYGNPLGATKLREMVTSPAGTTHAAMVKLKDKNSGLDKLMSHAINNAYLRAVELGG